MGKNKKTKEEPEPETKTETKTKTETETETETDTDTETEVKNKKKKSNKNNSMFSKFNNLTKKTKLYIFMILVLFIIAGYMWYKNKKTETPKIQNEVKQMKHLSPSPIREIQMTQGVVPTN